MTRWIASILAALLVAGPQPAFAYLKFGVTIGGRQVTLKWAQTPARYSVSTQGAPDVSVADFQDAVGRAFNTWQSVPTSTITYQFAGLTAAVAGRDDGLSTLGFQNRPDLDRVLGQTRFVIDRTSGALISKASRCTRSGT
jgi:hypothetical protein